MVSGFPQKMNGSMVDEWMNEVLEYWRAGTGRTGPRLISVGMVDGARLASART